MLTILIAVSAGVIVGYFSALQWGLIWGIILGFLAVIALQLLIGLIIRKKVNGINNSIQAIMTDAQNHINKKIRMFQMKPQGNQQTMQRILEKDQEKFIKKVIEQTDLFAPYCKWNLLLKKQMNTMKMMYSYQLKDFKVVDEMLPGSMFIDSRAVAIKIARMYKNNEEGIEKFYNKKVKKFKGDAAVIVYALYSWILVRENRIDEAVNVLVEGKNKTSNEVLTANWEALANGKVKKFSNAGLGEDWYSLYLENPKVKAQRARRAF